MSDDEIRTEKGPSRLASGSDIGLGVIYFVFGMVACALIFVLIFIIIDDNSSDSDMDQKILIQECADAGDIPLFVSDSDNNVEFIACQLVTP